MSVQIRKKSHSFNNLANTNNVNNNSQSTQRTVNKNDKKGGVSACRSVSAFRESNGVKNNKLLVNKWSSNQIPTRRQFDKVCANDMGNKSLNNNNYLVNENNNSNVNQLKKMTNKSFYQTSAPCYKEAIEKRKRKQVSSLEKNAKINEQLFLLINTFQQALCSLPLNKLILSENPFRWLQEQEKTFKRLNDSFLKIQGSLQEQNKQYYLLKLQTISVFLTNIQQNLQTLDKISLIKNMTSGETSQSQSCLQSRNSQSSTSIFGVESKSNILHKNTKNNKQQTFNFPIKINQAQKYNKLNKVEYIQQSQCQTQSRKSYDHHSKYHPIRQESNKQNIMGLINLNQQGQAKILQKTRQNLQKSNNSQFQSRPSSINKKGQQQINQKSRFILTEYQSQANSEKQSPNINSHMISFIKQKMVKKQGSPQENRKSFRNNEKNLCDQNNQTRPLNQKRKIDLATFYTSLQQQTYEGPQLQTFKKKNSKILNKTVSKYENNKNSNQYQQQNHNNNNRLFEQNQSKQTFNTIINHQTHIDQTNIQQQQFQNNENLSKLLENRQLSSKERYFKKQQNFLTIIQQLQKKIISLTKQIQIKNKIIVGLQDKNQNKIRTERQEFQKKQKQYLQTIYEYKNQCNEKQRAIRELLIGFQTKKDQVQLMKKELNQKGERNKVLDEKLRMLQDGMQQMIKQLKIYKIRQQQLRQTVYLQRQRTKKLQKQLQTYVQQIQHFSLSLKQKQTSLTSLLQQNKTLKQSLKSSQKLHQKQLKKQEIYKSKYFLLIKQYQKLKTLIQEDEYYWKKVCMSCKREVMKQMGGQEKDGEKVIQLKELIAFHKRRLVGKLQSEGSD